MGFREGHPMKKHRLFIFLTVFLLYNLAHGQTATLHYESEPGDYIGIGETHTYTEADGTFAINQNYDNGVNVIFYNIGEYWNLNFAAPYEAELSVGYYPNAQRWPFQDADKPGLQFFGNGRGCNTLAGEFTVNKMIYDYFGVPRLFAATLEQHCEDAIPALYGSIDYDFGGIGPTAFTTGNILVTNQKLLMEFSPDGTLVQRIPVLRNGDASPDITAQIRDVIVSDTGHVHIFNGTFTPALSSFDPVTGEWQHSTFSGWGISNNVSYGHIGTYKQYVFVNDQLFPRGIIRFNTDTRSGQRYALDFYYIDINVGLDDRLYALVDETMLHVYDPVSMSLLDDIILENNVRGIAVNADGEIFGASWDGSIYHFDSSGAYQASIATGIVDLSDIDLSPTGQIAVGARDTKVILTTESLSSVEMFTPVDPEEGSTFVGFVRERTVIFRNSFESPTSAGLTSTN
jgi:hypothetical protein